MREGEKGGTTTMDLFCSSVKGGHGSTLGFKMSESQGCMFANCLSVAALGVFVASKTLLSASESARPFLFSRKSVHQKFIRKKCTKRKEPTRRIGEITECNACVSRLSRTSERRFSSLSIEKDRGRGWTQSPMQVPGTRRTERVLLEPQSPMNSDVY